MGVSCGALTRLVVMLLASAWLLGCSDGEAGDGMDAEVPTLTMPPARGLGAGAGPGVSEIELAVSPAVDEEGADLPVLAVHSGTRLVNQGHNYVYGELLQAGECLRVSYFDSGEPPLIGGGLLLVWPLGYDFQVSDGVVEVLDEDEVVVAAVGDRVRLSGKRLRDSWDGFGNLEWFYGDRSDCKGSYWLVGDEVTSLARTTSEVGHEGRVFFPNLRHQTGGIMMSLEGMTGRLALRGDCLVLEVSWPPREYLVVWPPGFRAVELGGGISVVNGGGSVIARVGDDVILGGRGGPSGVSYSAECEGDYYNAYSVEVDSGN